jgi:foldase protein PrsA
LRTYSRYLVGGLLAGLAFLLLAGLAAGCGNRPVAVVNGRPITDKEFTDRLKREAGNDVLMGMVARRLVEDEFAKSGLTVDPAKVEEGIAKVKGQFPDEQAALDALAKRGQTIDDLRQEVELSVKAEMLQTKDVRYTDADLQKYFEENRKQRFDKPERVSIRDIIVTSQAEADKVYALAQQPNANFADLARQYSLNPQTRQNGGLTEDIPLEGLPSELKATIGSLKAGQVSKPTKMGQGPTVQFFIIKVEARKPAEKATFEQSRKEVEDLYKASRAKQGTELLTELRKSAKVTIYDPQFQELNNVFQADQQQLPQFGGGAAGGQGKAPAPDAGAQPQGGQPPAPGGQ